MDETTVRWIVRGRVQGVGYRHFTVRSATALGLRGTVRNRSDGTVEVDVRGSPEALDRFRARLLRGPSWAEVDGIDERESPAPVLPERFEVRF